MIPRSCRLSPIRGTRGAQTLRALPQGSPAPGPRGCGAAGRDSRAALPSLPRSLPCLAAALPFSGFPGSALPGSGNACPVIQEADEPLPPAFPSGAALRGRGEGGGGRRGGGRRRQQHPRPGPVRPSPRPCFHGAGRAGEPGLTTPPAHGPRRGGGGQGEAPRDLHHGEQAHRDL